MKKVIYQAIFLDENSIKKLINLQKDKLPNVPNDMHCTFKFMPSEKEIEDFARMFLGKPVTLRVVGYCSDGKNSGFEVALEPEQESVYTNAHTVKQNGISKVERTTPHITVSMSAEAKAVDTGFLDFKPLDEPFDISGKAGFYVSDKEKGTKGVVYEQISKITPDQSETAHEK